MNVPHCLLFEPFDSSTSCFLWFMSLIPSRDVLAHGHCLSVVSSGKIDKNCNCLCVTEKKKKQTLHAHYCVYISTLPNYYQTMVGLSLRYLESMFILWFKKKKPVAFCCPVHTKVYYLLVKEFPLVIDLRKGEVCETLFQVPL